MRALLSWGTMGGYAVYVWSTYSVVLGTLVFGVLRARWLRVNTARSLQRSLETRG